MAQHKSAKKRIRRNKSRADINRRHVGRARTSVKKVELAIASGDKSAALEAFKAAEPDMQRGARKGTLHKRTAARKLSRLNTRIQKLG